MVGRRCASAALLFACGALGCAAQLPLVERSAVGGGPVLAFWPPPEATATWSGSTAALDGASLGDAADRVDRALRSAGYDEVRWYAIGARHVHGFAATTRLERIADDGTPRPAPERWLEGFPDAANLFWLQDARAVRISSPGRSRVLFVAFTDLPIGPTNRAPSWNEQTWMTDARPPRAALPPASSDYRLGAYVYAFASDPSGTATFLPEDDLPITTQLERSDLASLVGLR